jgi:hypothetical protein
MGTPQCPASALSAPAVRSGTDDAFFPDERATAAQGKDFCNPKTGVRENRFTFPPSNRKWIKFANPLEPDALVKAPALPSSAKIPYPEQPVQNVGKDFFGIFVPDTFYNPGLKQKDKNKVARVTLFFSAIGDELNRQGLCSFFEGLNHSILISIPGIEIQPRWGVGITKDMIDALFKSAKLEGQAYVITVLAAFSTGHYGMRGTILNTFWKDPLVTDPKAAAKMSFAASPLGLDLTKVETVVFYDCLYPGTAPVGLKPGVFKRTRLSLDVLRKATAKNAKPVHVVAYDVTDAGTFRDSSVPFDAKNPHRGLSAELKADEDVIVLGTHAGPIGDYLKGLVVARVISSGIEDGLVKRSAVHKDILALIEKSTDGTGINRLPPRGSLGSTKALAASGGAGKETLEGWGARNRGLIVGALKAMSDAIAIISDPQSKLMGPGATPGNAGDLMHDGFPAEFGWEYMAD